MMMTFSAILMIFMLQVGAFMALRAFTISPYHVRSHVTMKFDSLKYVAAVGSIGLLLSPVVSQAADLDAGEQIFNGNCAACHAGGNNVIQNEKTLRKDALTQYLDGGLKEASIVSQVTNGKNAMPAFGGRLDDDEISNVAAYVYDQASGSKWD